MAIFNSYVKLPEGISQLMVMIIMILFPYCWPHVALPLGHAHPIADPSAVRENNTTRVLGRNVDVKISAPKISGEDGFADLHFVYEKKLEHLDPLR
jgi:hypothetical protein